MTAYQLEQLSFGYTSSLYPWVSFEANLKLLGPYGALEPLLNSWPGLLYPLLCRGSALISWQ